MGSFKAGATSVSSLQPLLSLPGSLPERPHGAISFRKSSLSPFFGVSVSTTFDFGFDLKICNSARHSCPCMSVSCSRLCRSWLQGSIQLIPLSAPLIYTPQLLGLVRIQLIPAACSGIGHIPSPSVCHNSLLPALSAFSLPLQFIYHHAARMIS